MNKYKFESWNVAFRKRNDVDFEDGGPFIVIKNPLLYWAADPFVVFHDGKYYVFAELYHRLFCRGRIKYCVIDFNKMKASRWKDALSIKGHLSFPYIYRKGSDYYMMPESSKQNALSIYKATIFPFKWKFDSTIICGAKIADSIFLDEKTILTYDNYSRPRQYLVYRKSADGWTQTYRQDDDNVIFRPAGKCFNCGYKTVVPLQDSSSGEYGGGLYFAEIIDDSKGIGFKKIHSVDLKKLVFNHAIKNIAGVHTYNFDEKIEVIDVKKYTSNILSLFGYLFKKMRSKK